MYGPTPIKQETVNGMYVSTIFVPELRLRGGVIPGYYETMVFGTCEEYQKRCDCYYTALRQHDVACDYARTGAR